MKYEEAIGKLQRYGWFSFLHAKQRWGYEFIVDTRDDGTGFYCKFQVLPHTDAAAPSQEQAVIDCLKIVEHYFKPIFDTMEETSNDDETEKLH